MAAEAARTAVVDRLAAICVEPFNRDSEKDQKLKKLKELDSWNISDYVRGQGWATKPGENDSDSAVSTKCADLLAEIIG